MKILMSPFPKSVSLMMTHGDITTNGHLCKMVEILPWDGLEQSF